MKKILQCGAIFCAASMTVGLFLKAEGRNGAGQRWWSHVVYLAGDDLQGRNTGSEGHRKAAEYVAGKFKEMGLEPAGTFGYFQPVKFRSRRILEDRSSLALIRESGGEPLMLGEDAIFSMRIEPAAVLEAPVVFAGYGLRVPELKYDDFAGLDLSGKVVAYFSGGPSSIPGPLRSHYQSASERWKTLKSLGARGTIAILDPHHMDIPWPRSALARFQPAMTLTDPALDDTAGQEMSVTFNPEHADKLLAGSGHTFNELLSLADQGKPLPTFSIPVRVRAKVEFEASSVESQNVVGILRGADPKLSHEYVVLTAHLDHLGVGRPINGDSIYNGAMDNASGVASLLEIAQSLRESKAKLRRSLLFVTVTAEEKGLLGSKYFAAHPTVTTEAMIADLNIDMFLPLFPLRILTVMGLDESDLGKRIRAIAEPLGIKVQADPEPERNLFIRSDQYNFIRRGIPSLAFKVGFTKGSPEAATAKKWLTERYHAPSDDVQQPVDLDAAADFNHVIELLARDVANRTEPPKWEARSFFRRFVSSGADGAPAHPIK